MPEKEWALDNLLVDKTQKAKRSCLSKHILIGKWVFPLYLISNILEKKQLLARTCKQRRMILGIHVYQKQREQQRGEHPKQRYLKSSFRKISKQFHQVNHSLFPVGGGTNMHRCMLSIRVCCSIQKARPRGHSLENDEWNV